VASLGHLFAEAAAEDGQRADVDLNESFDVVSRLLDELIKVAEANRTKPMNLVRIHF
jgi:hypothetical protein